MIVLTFVSLLFGHHKVHSCWTTTTKWQLSSRTISLQRQRHVVANYHVSPFVPCRKSNQRATDIVVCKASANNDDDVIVVLPSMEDNDAISIDPLFVTLDEATILDESSCGKSSAKIGRTSNLPSGYRRLY
jgi:hypothetical protein